MKNEVEELGKELVEDLEKDDEEVEDVGIKVCRQVVRVLPGRASQ